jgi:hypothetical protein
MSATEIASLLLGDVILMVTLMMTLEIDLRTLECYTNTFIAH